MNELELLQQIASDLRVVKYVLLFFFGGAIGTFFGLITSGWRR